MPEEEASRTLDLWVAVTEPELLETALSVLAETRREGIRADGDLRGGSLKSQLKRANKARARFAAIVGPDELARDNVQLRDLAQASQEEVARADLGSILGRRLAEPPS